MSKTRSTLFGVPIRKIKFEQIFDTYESLGIFFDRKQQYDLFKLRELSYLPLGILSIEEGKDWVGAAIRICGYIGQAELADELRKIPGDCFIPDEEDVAIDPFRNGFLNYSSDEDA